MLTEGGLKNSNHWCCSPGHCPTVGSLAAAAVPCTAVQDIALPNYAFVFIDSNFFLIYFRDTQIILIVLAWCPFISGSVPAMEGIKTQILLQGGDRPREEKWE